NSKKYFLYGLISVVVLTITLTFITSKANYRMTASIPLTEGKVVSSPYDINVMAMYINDGDGNYQELSKETTIPTGYIINKENTYCCKGSNCKKENKDTNAILETIGGIHIFRGISKGDKCFIYLDKDISNTKTMSELLETHYIGRKTREEGTFNKIIENTTMGVIYEGEDDNGITYYFAGNPLDNWVEFGEYYWRIIRVNGDGSIRLIYQGRTIDENGNKLEPKATGEETQIGTSIFNDKNDDNAYVGYLYNLGEVRGLAKKSDLYNLINNWFNTSNLNQSSFLDKIDKNASFCVDRQPSTQQNMTNGKGGIGTQNTFYGARIRLYIADENKSELAPNPTYSCSNDDTFRYKYSTIGDENLKVLENPVGTISADELAFAGGVHGIGNINKNIYLYTGKSFWTFTPYWFYQSLARVFILNDLGEIRSELATIEVGVRPVINLRSDTEFTGDGTITNPYKVVMS
ncbi:MAG: hypothetical protein NC483_07475, partial [Ruminococcus sp.]|nr:hypothetical protein [Ruminococcus sp.]